MSHTKKVVHLISSLKIGGAENWLIDLLKNLPSDLEHHVIFFHDGPNHTHLKNASIKTYHIRGFVALYDPLFLWRLFSTIKKINPALIHSSLWSANFLGRIFAFLLGIPIICSIHSQLTYNFDGIVRTIIDRLSFALATHVVPVSNVVAESISHKRFFIAQNKITTIKNGIDCKRIQTIKQTTSLSRQDLGLHTDDFVIGSVGRFIKVKNFAWLMKQISLIKKEIPSTKLLLVGFGPEEQALRALTKQLSLEDSVIFVIGKPAVAYYALMDCFVMPSTQEGLSIALLEAMSCNLLCLVANKTAHHDVIQDGKNGFLFKTDDNSFICKIFEIAQNNNVIKDIGAHAYLSAMHEFSIKKMADAYYRLYKKYW